jgi:type I restriction enzyme M protein
LFPVDRKKILGDFYWEYADILRGIGVPPATYDQRIMAMMAVKLLIDNDKLMFNFEYNKKFGLPEDKFQELKGADTKATFKNIIANIETLGRPENLKYFEQPAIYNPGIEKNILAYLNHPKVFTLDAYIEELPNHYLEMVLDIYTYKANFTDYPKEQYKDLYEKTISRMKKLVGDLTGQHFTQKSIIQLMCEMALKQFKKNKTIAIYDPTSGTGSMIMEAAHYFHNSPKIKKDVEIVVYGQEYHAQTWLLSKIFLEISSLDGVQQGINNVIAFGNTLTAPMFAKDINGDDSFDFIIANPPFGVDWKHDYETVLGNMKSPDSHFMVVKDEKRKIVTPKKSDGQFLFMQHIIKLMENEKGRKKRAFAAIITSSTLISTGLKTGQAAIIRQKIFETGYVKAVIEQPNAMFSNTDIGTHIWFLDTEGSENIKILKADNLEEPLFTPLAVSKDKMKNGYSEQNIESIVKYLDSKKEFLFVSKNVAKENCFGINISKTIGHRIVELDYDLDILEQQINDLFKELQELHSEGW